MLVFVAQAVLLILSLPGVQAACQMVKSTAAEREWTVEVGTAVEFDGTRKDLDFGDYDSVKIQIDANTVVMIHTHPLGGPKPSARDIKVAQQTGIPDIVISETEEWIAMPDGSALRADQAEAIQNAVMIAQESGVVAGGASCAMDVKLLETAENYEACLAAVDQSAAVRSRKVLAGVRGIKTAQRVYAYCDDNVDWLTRHDYAACYAVGARLGE